MTKVLTVRVPPGLLSEADARASCLGMDRTRYVRHLIERDLAGVAEPAPGRFRSEDLAGRFLLGGKPATNLRVRQQMRRHGGRGK